jgi:hypothetical protein
MSRVEPSPVAKSPPRAASDPSIAPARRVLVCTVIAATLLASAIEIVRDGDHWPFSSYSMFAAPRAAEVRQKRLVGVRGADEIALVVPENLPPFHEARLLTAFRRLGRRDDAPHARRVALGACLDRYESLRRAGVHDGPALDGLRFYELAWPLADGARNRARPASRRLIAEVWR